MADFDIPGLGYARQALTKLAKGPAPSSSKTLTMTKWAMIRELYAELRAARLAGHSWYKIDKALRESGLKPYMSTSFISRAFHAIDLEYEKETGVKALPREAAKGGKRRKKEA